MNKVLKEYITDKLKEDKNKNGRNLKKKFGTLKIELYNFLKECIELVYGSKLTRLQFI